jgi:Ca2+-binding EF-hand superfamily protein
MSNARKNLIQQAFNKLDRSGDGVVTTEDLKGVYSAKKHPKYISGEWSEDDVLKEWLNSFNGPTNFSGVVRIITCRMRYG